MWFNQFVWLQCVLNCVLIELETVAILPVAVQWVQRKSHQLYRRVRLLQFGVCNAIKWSKAVRMSICQIEKSKRITRYPAEVLKLGLNQCDCRDYWLCIVTKGENYDNFDVVAVDDDPKILLFWFLFSRKLLLLFENVVCWSRRENQCNAPPAV